MPSTAELISLGENYLSDLDYERALVQFLKVIEIEPMNERAYLGAAEAYIGLGQTDNAIEILEQGLAALPDSTAIQEKLRELQPTPEPVAIEPTETEPANLTNKEPFSIQDFESIGVPYGATIWDVQGLLSINQVTIDRAFESMNRTMAEGTQSFTHSIFPDEYSNQNVSLYPDGRIFIINMNVDSSPFIVGPRGIELGMIINDILSLFMVQDEDVFSYSENSIEQAQIYTTNESDKHMSGLAGTIEGVGMKFDSYVEYRVIFPDEDDSSYNLTCYFTDGILSQYSIVFYYPDNE
jgi:tetratricopeptide (TPR) repeat protein